MIWRCWFLLLTFFSPPLWGMDLEIRSEFYSNHDFHISAIELFDRNDVPRSFIPQLESLLWKTEIPADGEIIVFKPQILNWLRDLTVSYNKNRQDPIRLRVPDKITVHSQTKIISPENVKRRIQSEVKNQCPQCEVQVKILGELPQINNFVNWKVGADGQAWKGKVQLAIVAEDQSYYVPVQIRWFDKVLSAKFQISSGKELGHGNIERTRVDVTHLNEPALVDWNRVQGMRARHVLRKGQVLMESALRRPQLIRYGQVVTVSVKEGAISLSTSAKSKGAGAKGDIIPVEILKTKKRIMAEVIDTKTVRVQ